MSKFVSTNVFKVGCYAYMLRVMYEWFINRCPPSALSSLPLSKNLIIRMRAISLGGFVENKSLALL